MEKTEVHPLLVRGTPIYIEVSFHTQTSPYTRTLPAALLYNRVIFLIMVGEGGGNQGAQRQKKRGNTKTAPTRTGKNRFFLPP